MMLRVGSLLTVTDTHYPRFENAAWPHAARRRRRLSLHRPQHARRRLLARHHRVAASLRSFGITARGGTAVPRDGVCRPLAVFARQLARSHAHDCTNPSLRVSRITITTSTTTAKTVETAGAVVPLRAADYFYVSAQEPFQAIRPGLHGPHRHRPQQIQHPCPS